jgi:hypothetical protein
MYSFAIVPKQNLDENLTVAMMRQCRQSCPARKQLVQPAPPAEARKHRIFLADSKVTFGLGLVSVQ